jgi:hypothetical protein
MFTDQCASSVSETIVRTRIRKLSFHGKDLYIEDEYTSRQQVSNGKAHIETLNNEDRKVDD